MLECKFRKNANNNDGFRDYLKTSKSDLFVLDLSNCTLIECIDKMCDIFISRIQELSKIIVCL